jgi:hypothetical protein
MTTPELPLFEPPEVPPVPEGDVDAFAQHIADHAPQVDYPDRTSEAARDQGWGPVNVRSPETDAPVNATPSEVPAASLSRPLVELPRPGYDNNPLSGVTPAEARKGMSQAEIEAQDRTNALGFAAARAAFNKTEE